MKVSLTLIDGSKSEYETTIYPYLGAGGIPLSFVDKDGAACVVPIASVLIAKVVNDGT